MVQFEHASWPGRLLYLPTVKRRNIKKDEYTTVIAIFDRKSWGTLGNVGEQLGDSWVTVG